jgi:DNA-binding PadR family transcriptional regulator
MRGDSFAQEWPGRGAWGRKEFSEEWGEGPRGGGPHRHRHQGPAERLFAKARRHGPLGPEDLEKIEDLIAWRRMRGGPFGFGGPGPFGHGPRGRGRGRARRGDVRLALLRLLAEEPRNGYQLMQTIETRSGGRWTPSPGSVYPTLAQLEDEGLIGSTDGEGSRMFTITDAGREHLQTRAQEPDPWEPSDSEGESALTELGPLVIQIGKAAWQVATVGDQAQRARAIEVLSETRRALYRILAEEPPDDSGESDV